MEDGHTDAFSISGQMSQPLRCSSMSQPLRCNSRWCIWGPESFSMWTHTCKFEGWGGQPCYAHRLKSSYTSCWGIWGNLLEAGIYFIKYINIVGLVVEFEILLFKVLLCSVGTYFLISPCTAISKLSPSENHLWNQKVEVRTLESALFADGLQ